MSDRLTGPVRHEAEIRKSRFIAHAAPVDDEEAARAFIDQVSDSGATHNCWAWRIGGRYRFDDDGEPGGTAGRPILQAIESQDFDCAVVVVTRFFGGIKLGTGGLARAYSGTASEALRTAARKPIIKHVRLLAVLPFACIDAAHQAMAGHGGEKLHETYLSNGVELLVSVPESNRDAFVEQVRNLARGEARIRRI